MPRCCICGTSVSTDCESINIGFIKKKAYPVCDKCGLHLKHLSDKNLTEQNYIDSRQYFEKYSENIINDGVKKYIKTCEEKRIKEQNKKPRKSRGTVYYVDKLPLGAFNEMYGRHNYKVPIIIPQKCTCCLKETTASEVVTAKCTEYGPGNVKKTRNMQLEFPVCNECRDNRTRPSVKITSFTIDFASFGLMFTSEEYVKEFCDKNQKTYSSFEDDGFISNMY